MKAIILCGGLGTRISEYTKIMPKPMIKIGNKPILLHIFDTFLRYGINEFYLATGYKKKVIYDYFNNTNSFKKDYLKQKKPFIGKFYKKDIKINLIDTGLKTLTGGRLKRFQSVIDDENFFLTYGDGLSNVNLSKLLKFHKKKSKIATVTTVVPPARFGALVINENNLVTKFSEKNHISNNWINGGYFVFNYKIFDYIKNDFSILEKEPLIQLSKKKQLAAFKHESFWQCMDTVRDREILTKLYRLNPKPWLI